jgi:hypothetical protein
MRRWVALVLLLVNTVQAAASTPPMLPHWLPTYNMSESSVVQPCNYSGLYDFETYPELARYGLVDYDWSNAKRIWIDHSPMDCDTLLVEQAARNKAHNPTTKVFVYRNIVEYASATATAR